MAANAPTSPRRVERRSKAVVWTVADYFAPKIIAGLLSIRPAEARIVRREAALLGWLREGDRYIPAGLGTFHAFVEEHLQMRPGTARERVRLHRILRDCPLAEKAFLEGKLTICKILTLGSVLKRTPEKAAGWIKRARKLSVRKLRLVVKKELPDAEVPEPMSAISFHAPPLVHLAFEEVIELGRMRLGHNGPLYEVIEALLAETGYSGSGGEPKPKPPHKPAPIVLQGSPRPPGKAVARVAKTLEQLTEYLELIDAVSASAPPSDVYEALAQMDQLRDLEKPLRIFQAQLLRDLRETRAVYVLGFRSVAEFVENHLGISERTARTMVADAELFEDIPQMIEEYLSNRISLGKAHRIKCLTHGFGDEAFNRRAREVTHRQFHWETRFLLHLSQCFPFLGHRFRGPLPQPGLEEALVNGLCEEGWKKEEIEKELGKRNIEPIKEGCSLDPAENPVVMRRLQALLDMLAAAHWEDPPEVDDRLPAPDRRTSSRRRPVIIRIPAPPAIVADWRMAISKVREELGPFAQEWQAAVALFAHVHDEWSCVDPEAKPKHFKVFKRDGHLCQAPACPKREDLQGHHLNPRSRGGSNALSNLMTLCFRDHQYEIHAGYAKVSGEVPQALLWELGCRSGRQPLLVLKGERIVGGSRMGGGRPPRCDVRRSLGK